MYVSFEFIRAALRASGAETEAEFNFWTGKLHILQSKMPEFPNSARGKAQALFRWLWKDRPFRYISGGSFRLTEVIDAQLDPEAEHVGNCLGLTLLFNSMAQLLGLKVAAINMDEAFGTGPHVLSLIYTEEGTLQIENIMHDGFDYRAHMKEKQVLWDGKALVADIYNSIGTESFLKGEMERALTAYEQALSFNPAYEKVKLNLGIILAQLGKEKEAEKVLIFP